MISCQTFRATLRPGTEDASSLQHLRSCDACVEFAVGVDPDYFFRAIGGEEMVPPGGIDAFVGDVMAQVRVRGAEGSVATRLPMNRYLPSAAALLFVIAGATGVYWHAHQEVKPGQPVVARVSAPPVLRPQATKAVVESYQSQNATIVELPSASDSDVKVVMIYDESLPADL